MNDLALSLGWLGLYAPMALGAIGSMIGCSLAGQAAIGAMLETESGHGKYLGVSVMPSSQLIYGIVVMFTLNREITEATAPGVFGIGLLAGLALMASAIFQGKACASAINASKAKPDIFGLSLAPSAIVEGFAVFAFIFALVISAGIPGS
ncbi:ATP synthase subunit C [Geoalkalibacter halelectricus]|uniref:ATP synthase subunit C n=1 Tax=Geoalkalibacter halelectricus TaxID=2847045 RepID=A0ABY5ZMX6_9BACT|nr:ATP synthase subunit C [Geoalkalibacter halelectricus]MDO3379951.1 ATP synthase subunit C [Geoalkalibacter halelectricus]UWZ80522.1 ATP synthase subunit C [Geoalkalibacter halelectricus]